VPPVHDLIRAIDQAWSGSDSKILLRIIGASALGLRTGYDRGTKDSDVLETAELDRETKARLLELAGPDKPLAKRHQIYIEFVASGLPLLPQTPNWVDLPELNQDLEHFRVEVLDVTDVVVSKLKRLHGNDKRDIDAMIDRRMVSHPFLIERFNAAVDYLLLDSRAADLPRYIENLHEVERDLFLVDETEIELPSWIDVDAGGPS
jgi:hypothetical protein